MIVPMSNDNSSKTEYLLTSYCVPLAYLLYLLRRRLRWNSAKMDALVKHSVHKITKSYTYTFFIIKNRTFDYNRNTVSRKNILVLVFLESYNYSLTLLKTSTGLRSLPCEFFTLKHTIYVAVDSSIYIVNLLFWNMICTLLLGRL